jgi:hypothetical protein
MLKRETPYCLASADIGEVEPTTISSDIGPIDPADYFPYLLGIHEISESDQPWSVREAALRQFLTHLEWERFNNAHGGAEAVIARVLP